LIFDPPPAPPSDLSALVEFVLKKDVEIHRVWKHATGRAANVFNPGYGDADPTRFAPIQRPIGLPEGERVGTLYAGETFDVAVYETLFRDLPPHPGPRDVLGTTVDQNAHCKLKVGRDLKLAALFDKHLKNWGLSREALIGCRGRDAYRGTVLWAEAIYDQFPHIDGLVWMSRQDETGRAYFFFGDRVRPSDLTPEKPRPLSRGAGKRDLETLANRDAVTITGP
jgi:hypothetical protein